MPGTPVSGFCKSGLSASEDSDHISEKRRIKVYRLKENDRRGETGRETKSGVVVMSDQQILLVM